MTAGDWIQLAAVLAALGASVVALIIATLDRRTQMRIARATSEQNRLAVELEYAIRLSANRNRAGSSDPEESKRLGAEAMALVGVIGPRWVPIQYQHVMAGMTPDQIAAKHADPDTPDWMKWRTESTLAVQAIVDAMYPPQPESQLRRRSTTSRAGSAT